MSDETVTTDLPTVTDRVTDWDWLDDQWDANAIDIWNSVHETRWANGQVRGPRNLPVVLNG